MLKLGPVLLLLWKICMQTAEADGESVREDVNDIMIGAGILHEDVPAVAESIVAEENLDIAMMIFLNSLYKKKETKEKPKAKKDVYKNYDNECSTVEDSDVKATVSRN
ncbi:hypothetical protein M9458_054160 [Cirrhinus mrigala]|uniref:Uncharacterized protein n=1 Tax=Cirrhinus mrigala TaxID=683832 RepID=A0ABD0MP72_CIRMR